MRRRPAGGLGGAPLMVPGRLRMSWSGARAARPAQGDGMARAGVSGAGGAVLTAEGAASRKWRRAKKGKE